MNIIVNGTSIALTFPNDTPASYEDVCWLAGRDPTKVFTVVWSRPTRRGSTPTRRGSTPIRCGSITKGGSCVLTDGMIFNVTDTSYA